MNTPRLHYYNPVLDPHCQAKMTAAHLDAVANMDYPESDGGPLNEPDECHPANLLSSLCEDGMHRPALDIDVPMIVRESATPGHYHVEFPTIALDWDQYLTLLDAMAAVGIVEPAYVAHSRTRGQTLLRVPGYPRPPRRTAEKPTNTPNTQEQHPT